MGGLGDLGSLLFVNVSDGECSKGLHESGSVVGSRSIGKGKHGPGGAMMSPAVRGWGWCVMGQWREGLLV